ncbi:MAG: hypothetical protein ACLQLT_03975 [Methylovirgula sp.]
MDLTDQDTVAHCGGLLHEIGQLVCVVGLALDYAIYGISAKWASDGRISGSLRSARRNVGAHDRFAAEFCDCF